jgi:acetolactate synthase-1/2/3 large subunit
MKLTDVLASILIKKNIGHVFGLQGGAVVHIFDSLEKYGLGVTYMHHEQSAALAAVAYSKISEKIGCVVVTTGPGATNALTGLLAAWQDSIPCVFISGQVRSQHMSYGRKVRQVGTQEVNICDIVRPITKYCDVINAPEEFERKLNQAIKIAKEGRPGPVWIDLPLEFQWGELDFKAESLNDIDQLKEPTKVDTLEFERVEDFLLQSKTPLLILGYGVRLAECTSLIKDFVATSQIPFVTTWTASDLFPTSNELNLGVIGMSGQRGANKAVFNSDLLICLGTHLSIPHTTTLYESYAPSAKKIIINIDGDQLKNLNIKFDLKIKSDLAPFLKWIIKKNIRKPILLKLHEYKSLNWYRPKNDEYIDTNYFVHELTKRDSHKCVIVDGGGTALYAGFQSAFVNEGDRIICSSAISAMGTGLAETVGVSKSNSFKKYYCIIGDGSFLMNVQDLQSIKQDNINVCICVINNNGYLAIRNTQKEFLGGKFYGTHPSWKLEMPSIEKLANGFQIPYIKIESDHDLNQVLALIAKINGPLICEVVVSEDQPVLFKQGYKAFANNTFEPLPLSEMIRGGVLDE